MIAPKRSAADTLRLIVRNMDDSPESFNDRFPTPLELVRIYDAHLRSGWDISPARWDERQVREALAGIAPQWREDDDGAVVPVYAGAQA